MKLATRLVLVLILGSLCFAQEHPPAGPVGTSIGSKVIPISQESKQRLQSIQRDINNLLLQMENIVLKEQVKIGDAYQFNYETLTFQLKEDKKDDKDKKEDKKEDPTKKKG